MLIVSHFLANNDSFYMPYFTFEKLVGQVSTQYYCWSMGFYSRLFSSSMMLMNVTLFRVKLFWFVRIYII